MSFGCAYCHKRHETVAEVRACAEKRGNRVPPRPVQKAKPKAASSTKATRAKPKVRRRVRTVRAKNVSSGKGRNKTRYDNPPSNAELHKRIGSTQNYGDDT